jgi:hypothetical protein
LVVDEIASGKAARSNGIEDVLKFLFSAALRTDEQSRFSRSQALKGFAFVEQMDVNLRIGAKFLRELF